ncbi:MAG: histidinol dehydrogenase, partial [Bacteroidia bacterium]|nr:histidinol dehydrogenase [Bacteroidia bacterium]
MKRVNYPSRSEWPVLLQRPAFDSANLHTLVGEILNTVRKRGDEAVHEYGLKYDKVSLIDLEVSTDEITDKI